MSASRNAGQRAGEPKAVSSGSELLYLGVARVLCLRYPGYTERQEGY
jgi:hypothetical protein